MTKRLGDHLAPMIQKAFDRLDARDDADRSDWFWEMSINPHPQQGSVLYLCMMAPAPGPHPYAVSTGLVIPGPGTQTQASIDSLVEALMEQIKQARQNPGELVKDEIVRANGSE